MVLLSTHTVVTDIVFIAGGSELSLIIKMEKRDTAAVHRSRGGVVQTDVTPIDTSGHCQQEY